MKIAVITGASSGMGRELTIQISKKESFDQIWVIARREEALLSLKDEVGENIRPVVLDLTKQESFDEYKALLRQEKPEVAFLANVAGFGKFGRFDQIPLQDCLDMID